MAGTLQYFVDSTGQAWSLSVNPDGSLTTTAVSSSVIPPVTSALYTITVGNIIDSVIQDAQVGTNNRVAILDYVDRVNKRALRESQWLFLRSQPQKFITQTGITDYWLADGTAPSDAANTNLNLSNLWSLDVESVFDRTNHKQLVPDSPSALNASASLSSADASPSYARPRSFRYDLTNPGLLKIFPAPDNQNSYQPVPMSPVCSIVSGGSLPNRTYFVSATFVDSQGNEGTASKQSAVIFVPAGYVLRVQAPKAEIASADQTSYSNWNVYVGESGTTQTKQNSTSLTGVFTEPTSGLVTGTVAPTNSTLVPLQGYVIEFAYFAQRQTLTLETQTLQVPDVYRDVIIAGVNFYVNLYLNKDPELSKSTLWKQEFLEGLRQIRKDLHINYRTTNFIAPDSSSQALYSTGLTAPGLGRI